MDDSIHLCLLDCSSIQDFVFGSNKLKSNIGASHLVAKIYDDWIPGTLLRLFSAKDQWSFNCWHSTPEAIALASNPNLLMETGYVGGGNALLMFRAEDDAKEFVKRWTRKLLLYAPGIRPVTALVSSSLNDLHGGIKKAFDELTMNKSSYFPETTIFRHGVTAECKMTGLSQEARSPFAPTEWLSSEACAKLRLVEEANAELAREYRNVLKDEYEFPDETENLGQVPGEEGHVAIVHIDGNNIGQRFKACGGDLVELRRLSLAVDRANKRAMEETLSKLLSKMSELNKKIFSWKDKGKTGKNPLPLRPIILNGDDVTFVCEARIGLFLAETYMREFARQPALPETLPFSACAGVAIVRTKYPFYRGYTLAEELCSSAKKKGRIDNTSWLDFHVAYRGLSASLSETRKQRYQVGNDSLLWRPWKITDTEEMFAFQQLKNAMQAFTQHPVPKQRWPEAKINQLAQSLAKGRQRTEEFIKIINARNLCLPPIAGAGTADTSGWQLMGDKFITPYFDVYEAMKFYPECLWEKAPTSQDAKAPKEQKDNGK